MNVLLLICILLCASMYYIITNHGDIIKKALNQNLNIQLYPSLSRYL